LSAGSGNVYSKSTFELQLLYFSFPSKIDDYLIYTVNPKQMPTINTLIKACNGHGLVEKSCFKILVITIANPMNKNQVENKNEVLPRTMNVTPS
jgi:hypothetical protein